MERRRDGGRPTLHNPAIGCIVHRARRDVLKLLVRRKTALGENQVLKAVIANEPGVDAGESEDVRRSSIDLVHKHLPALEAAGLVSWDRDGGTVETAAHPAQGDPRFEYLLGIDADGVDDVFSALSHEHRRLAIIVLRSEQSRLSLTELSNAVSDRFAGETDPAVVSASLYHGHLPKLARWGFVEFDVETGSSAYAAHPVLEEVLAVIYEPDVYLVDRFEGFLDGLQGSLAESGLGERHAAGWPHNWSESPNG